MTELELARQTKDLNLQTNISRRSFATTFGAACTSTILFPQKAFSLQQNSAGSVQDGGAVQDDRSQDDRSVAELMDARTQTAVEEGLAFLSSTQSTRGSFFRGPYAKNVAVVGLAGLAFLSQGSVPGQGKYSVALRRCLSFMLTNIQANGFITNKEAQSHGPMYGHGFATLFLAEVYGSSPGPDVKEKLKLAVQLIVDTQNDDGGWRYQPKRDDADISVSICQIMALRAARNAGIHVPNETIDACIEFVKRSQNGDGGFMYMLDGGPSAFPRTAAGTVALLSAGVYEGPEVEQGLAYIRKNIPKRERGLRESHYFYGHYYAVQAMWHAGGETWKTWYVAIRDDLLNRQQRNGSWLDGISAEYGTAMACIILQMPNNSLPIFQR